MAIFPTSFVLFLVSLVFMSITPPSTAKMADTEIKHLCLKTGNPGACYKLLKSDHRTANVDARGLAEVAIDLASNYAKKIHAKLDSFSKATHDLRMRNAYKLCAKISNGAINHLEAAKKDLKSSAYKNMPAQVKDASEEIKSCEKVFNAASSDHAHMKKKIQDLVLRLDLVDVTVDYVNKK